MSSYEINNFRMERQSTDVAGYRITRRADYSQRAANLYRPISTGAGGTFPSRYGTHEPTVIAAWDSGDEPRSRFLSDEPAAGVHDLLALNNLLGREKSCLVGSEERMWHVESVGPCVTLLPAQHKFPFLEAAMRRIQGLSVGQIEYARLRSILWLMESWNSRAFDIMVILLRSSMELLWAQDRAGFRDQLDGIATWLRSRSLQPLDVLDERDLLHYFVINRHIRNFATHSGGFLGGQINSYGNDIEGTILREITSPNSSWDDGEPTLAPVFQAAVAQHGLDLVLLSSVQFLDCVLYCVAIDWLGIALDDICHAIAPLCHYLNELVWDV